MSKRTRALVALALTVALAPSLGPASAAPGFQAAFPRDHGAHPGYRTEWWYVTGHWRTPDGRQFGFQLTFFRFETRTKSERSASRAWRTDEIHLAHAALTDVNGKAFHHEEKLNRGGVMAAARVGDMDVFNENWRLARRPDGSFHLEASVDGRTLELDLAPTTPVVQFGQDGYLQKGKEVTTGSHYFSFPALALTGRVRSVGGELVVVKGQAWMDHEISAMQLEKGIAGWDWAGIQLKDGRSLMMYRLRREDGATSPWSMLTEVNTNGGIGRATRRFDIEAAGHWHSPRSKASYPLPLRVQAWGESWTLVPAVADQELRTRHATYWEGACKVLGADGREIGQAYLELTGYAHSMQGRL